jgi:hypothetical protein
VSELWANGPLELPHEFWVDDRFQLLPEIPTATLLGWAAYGSWWELYPASVESGQMLALMRRFADDDDEYDYEHLYDVASTLFGRLSGLASPDGVNDGWWPARRLAATALAEWPSYSAWCAAHGNAPIAGPLHQVMGAIFGWLIDRAGPDGYDKLAQQVFDPPPHALTANVRVLPQAIRDQEAALALASLGERLPGEEFVPEWTGPST